MLVKVISFSILHAVQEPRDGTNHGYKLSQSLGPIFFNSLPKFDLDYSLCLWISLLCLNLGYYNRKASPKIKETMGNNFLVGLMLLYHSYLSSRI